MNDNDLQITLLGSTIGHMQMQNMKCKQRVLLRALQMTLAILVNIQLHNTFSIVWDCCGVFCLKNKKCPGSCCIHKKHKAVSVGLVSGRLHPQAETWRRGRDGGKTVCVIRPTSPDQAPVCVSRRVTRRSCENLSTVTCPHFGSHMKSICEVKLPNISLTVTALG